MKVPLALGVAAILLVPTYASAQSPDRITLIDSFGAFESGEPLLVYGSIARTSPGSFLILQIVNPRGDLCQRQQLVPRPGGEFITDAIPLTGRICGIAGQYEVRLFYGDQAKSASFTVSSSPFREPGPEERLAAARALVEAQAALALDRTGVSHEVPAEGATLEQLRDAYVLAWGGQFHEEYLYEADPLVREAAADALGSVGGLLASGEIPAVISETLSAMVHEAIFLYGTGDKAGAIGLLSDVFSDLQKLSPEEPAARELTFDELEDTLLNLMTKSGTILGGDVKSEVAFIFSRGTAPVHSQEITALVDILSESRYLDVVSRKSSPLYGIVQANWDNLKPSLQGKDSIEDLLGSAGAVSRLYDAAILLRELDNVDRFISSDAEENGALAELIRPEWDSLESSLSLATRVDDILGAELEILRMKQITEISSRISKSVEISRSSGVTSGHVAGWEDLLDRVRAAESADEVLAIVSEFDRSITELRDRRSPLETLEFRYSELRERAELQADYGNLVKINNAIRIVDTARQMESGSPSISRIDRIEVLLTWASEQEPVIRADLESYTRDVSKVRAEGILTRAQSLENLVELSITKNRFLPNYLKFTGGLELGIAGVRDLVIKKDLDAADRALAALYDEWDQVSRAYAEDPRGSSVGYSLAELKRIDFRDKLAAFERTVSQFRGPGFAEYEAEYSSLVAGLRDMISRANFVDAESRVTEIAEFLSENLALSDPSIIFDVRHDPERGIWVMTGAVEKERFDSKDTMAVAIFGTDGSVHSELEITTTKHGELFTQWDAPREPGLYVAKLTFKDFPRGAHATQVINVAHEFEYEYTPSDLGTVSLARDFDDLKSFVVRFGGENVENAEIARVISETEEAFAAGDAAGIPPAIDELRALIDRHLPAKSREAIVVAEYADGELDLSGAVLKVIAFREDLYLDVYGQAGTGWRRWQSRTGPTACSSTRLTRPSTPGYTRCSCTTWT